jgi:hypothetical protein
MVAMASTDPAVFFENVPVAPALRVLDHGWLLPFAYFLLSVDLKVRLINGVNPVFLR